MTGRLEGKVALITGAGSGMGRAAAELFAAEGAQVVVSDVDEQAGDDAVAAIRAAGGDATFVRANVAEWNDCQAMVATATDSRTPCKLRFSTSPSTGSFLNPFGGSCPSCVT